VVGAAPDGAALVFARTGPAGLSAPVTRRTGLRRRVLGGDAILPSGMCAQCMATAMTAVGAASGARAWLAGRRLAWLTHRRLRFLTFALAAGAVVASATLVSGTG
jgi:hypothetical protein